MLLAQLENVSTNVYNLSKECDVCINIIYKGYHEWMGGWHLDKQIMSRILSLGADVDLDIYAMGPDLL